MGKHYCKACVGRVAVPLARFKPCQRTWLVALFDKLARRWYAVALMSLGLFVLGTGVLLVELPDKHASSHFQYREDAIGSTYSGQYTAPGISKTTSSIVIQAGAALVLAGVYFFARRFSLRWLLAGVLLVAALAAYPFVRIAGHPEMTHEIVVNGPAALSSRAFERVRTLLQPDRALGTLSPTMLQDLKLHPNSVQAVRVSPHGNSGVRCQVEFASDITDEQRGTLSAFFERYTVSLLCEKDASLPKYGNSVWSKYEPEWLNREGALLSSAVQNAR